MGMGEGQSAAVDQRNNGVFARVLAGMTTAARDAAAEKQFALGTVEHHVAGRFSGESPGFLAVAVQRHADAGNGFRRSAQGRPGPIIGDSFGPDEQHVDRNGILALPQKPIQFLDARARTRAIRMQEHQQGGAIRLMSDLGIGRPRGNGFAGATGRIFIAQKPPRAGSGQSEPKQAKRDISRSFHTKKSAMDMPCRAQLAVLKSSPGYLERAG